MITVGRFTIGAPDEGADIRLLPLPSRFDETGAMVPSPVYGQGTSADTQAFLVALGERDVAGKAVADVGTGTGILAIAAARLGATVTAYEVDPRAAAQAAANFALNGVKVDLRGAYPDPDAPTFDLVMSNTGLAVPDPDVYHATEVLVTANDDQPAVIVLADADVARPVLGAAVAEPPVPTYPVEIADAREALRGTPSKWADPEAIEDWNRTVDGIHAHAADVLSQFPEDEPHLARLVARGNAGKIKRHAYLRDVVAQSGLADSHWADVTVNLITLSCGCQHEQWFHDSEDMKTVRHHDTREQCAAHQGDGKDAWQRAHEHYDVLGEAQRMADRTTSTFEDGVLVLKVPAQDVVRVAALLRLHFGAQDWYRVA